MDRNTEMPARETNVGALKVRMHTVKPATILVDLDHGRIVAPQLTRTIRLLALLPQDAASRLRLVG